MINKQNFDKFEKITNDGILKTTKDFTQKGSWSFDYSGDSINIDSNSSFTLIGYRKNIDDGKVEVLNYIPNSLSYRMKATYENNASSVGLLDNRMLQFNYGSTRRNLKIYQFNSEFTIHQFIKTAPYYRNIAFPTLFNTSIMYIKVPKSLQILVIQSSGIKMIN